MPSDDAPGPRSDPRRRCQVGLVAAAVGVALFIVYIALWLGLPGSFRTANDFAPTFAAGQFVQRGDGSSIYDQARIVANERAAAPTGYAVNLPYISPPASALLAAPLAILSFSTAEAVYSLVQLLATIAAAALIALTVRWPVETPTTFRIAVGAAGIGTPAVGALLLFGESDGLFTLAVAAGYLLFIRRHPLAAGLAFGLGVGLGKPHLLIGVLAFLVFRRAMTVVIGCIVTAGVANVIAVAALGPSTALGFVSAVMHAGVEHPPSGLVGIGGLFASWLGNGTPMRVVGLLASAIVLALCARLGVISRRAPLHTAELLAAAFALSLLGSPHLLVPDLVVLIPAFMWLYPVLLGGQVPSWRITAPEALLMAAWAWIAAATVMDAANTSIGFPGRLTPWGLMLFAVAAWRAATRPPICSIRESRPRRPS